MWRREKFVGIGVGADGIGADLQGLQAVEEAKRHAEDTGVAAAHHAVEIQPHPVADEVEEAEVPHYGVTDRHRTEIEGQFGHGRPPSNEGAACSR